MRFWKLCAFSMVPVLAAASTGLWYARRLSGADPRAEAARRGHEEVVAQDRLLVDAVWGGIETLRARANGLREIRAAQARAGLPLAVPEGSILHWAELEARAEGPGQGLRLRAVRQAARNPGWVAGPDTAAFERHYLASALARLSLAELDGNGVALLRLKQDALRKQEWLALAFPADRGRGAATGGVLLALVDPSEAFPVFGRWSARSEGGKLRGYLVGSDGFVLAHSQRAYVASDFSSTGAFREGIRALLRGQGASGAGTFKGIDGVPVHVAYSKPGSLPIAAVVERAVPLAPATLAEDPFAAMAGSPKEALQGLLSLFLIGLGIAAGARGLMRRAPRSEAELPDPVRLAVAGDPQGLASPAPSVPLRTAPGAMARDPLACVSSAPARGLEPAGDPAASARRLAESASVLMKSPALFFGTQPRGGSVSLQAHAGFPAESVPAVEAGGGGVSFPLTAAMLERISRYEREGKTATLADDPGLALLLAKRFGSRPCDAWPVTDGAGRLLGILVVLGSLPGPGGAGGSRPPRARQIESLGKMVKNAHI